MDLLCGHEISLLKGCSGCNECFPINVVHVLNYKKKVLVKHGHANLCYCDAQINVKNSFFCQLCTCYLRWWESTWHTPAFILDLKIIGLWELRITAFRLPNCKSSRNLRSIVLRSTTFVIQKQRGGQPWEYELCGGRVERGSRQKLHNLTLSTHLIASRSCR